jgi:hypothetical protein
MIYKTLHKKIKCSGVNSDAPEGSAVNSTLVPHVVLIRLPGKRINILFLNLFRIPLIIYILYYIEIDIITQHYLLINKKSLTDN